jgi:hypothetical protein
MPRTVDRIIIASLSLDILRAPRAWRKRNSRALPENAARSVNVMVALDGSALALPLHTTDRRRAPRRQVINAPRDAQMCRRVDRA